MVSLIRNKDQSSLDTALRILDHYEGEPTTFNALKEIIAEYTITEELKIRLFHILSGIKGVVGGDYGFCDAYKLKIEQANSLLNDPNPIVKQFAIDYVSYLRSLIITEKDRVDKQVSFRDREFEMEKSDETKKPT
jgi:hypothetical protein